MNLLKCTLLSIIMASAYVVDLHAQAVSGEVRIRVGNDRSRTRVHRRTPPRRRTTVHRRSTGSRVIITPPPVIITPAPTYYLSTCSVKLVDDEGNILEYINGQSNISYDHACGDGLTTCHSLLDNYARGYRCYRTEDIVSVSHCNVRLIEQDGSHVRFVSGKSIVGHEAACQKAFNYCFRQASRSANYGRTCVR